MTLCDLDPEAAVYAETLEPGGGASGAGQIFELSASTRKLEFTNKSFHRYLLETFARTNFKYRNILARADFRTVVLRPQVYAYLRACCDLDVNVI